MGRRGPRSVDEQAVAGVISLVPREPPPPPDELTDEQAEVWRDCLRELPPDWIRVEARPVLAQYVRHVVIARKLAKRIEATTDDDLADARGRAEYARLLRQQTAQTAAISSLATRLRFTPQSSISPRRAGRLKADQPTGAKPWEFGE